MVRILEARDTPRGETLIKLANQPRQPGACGIDQDMDPFPLGACGRPTKVGFQNGHVGSMRGDVRRPPGREQGERVVDQLAVVRGRGAGAERVVLASKHMRVLKAGVDLVCQPPFDPSDILMIKELWGQSRDVARLIPVEEAAQRHSDMTGIPVHRPPDEGLDVAHQVVIRGRLIPRFLAGSPAFLFAFAYV